jgi:hypothetical protein
MLAIQSFGCQISQSSFQLRVIEKPLDIFWYYTVPRTFIVLLSAMAVAASQVNERLSLSQDCNFPCPEDLKECSIEGIVSSPPEPRYLLGWRLHLMTFG